MLGAVQRVTTALVQPTTPIGARAISTSRPTVRFDFLFGPPPILPPCVGLRIAFHGTTRSDVSSIVRDGARSPLFVDVPNNPQDPDAFDKARAYALIASKAVQKRNLGSLGDPVILVINLRGITLATHDQLGTHYVLPGEKPKIFALLDANTLEPTTVPPDGQPLRRSGSTALRTSIQYYGTIFGTLGGIGATVDYLPAALRLLG
ncbi:MAG: hypothetical protein AB7F28_02235 [Candidatus Margulisiibacteriota bacterium]